MKIFISYAREDEAFREELRKHLSGLLRQKIITDWHDRKLVAGQHWGREISAHLQASSVILLLVSPDFMASDYCWDVEMVHAFAMEKRGDAVLIPIVIRPVDFEDGPFSHLHALPRDRKPVSRWDDQDEAWVDVVKGIRAAIGQLRTPSAAPPTSALSAPTLEARPASSPASAAVPPDAEHGARNGAMRDAGYYREHLTDLLKRCDKVRAVVSERSWEVILGLVVTRKGPGATSVSLSELLFHLQRRDGYYRRAFDQLDELRLLAIYENGERNFKLLNEAADLYRLYDAIDQDVFDANGDPETTRTIFEDLV